MINIGDKFGYMEVIACPKKPYSRRRSFICRCNKCGTIKKVYASVLFSGKVTSCGCVNRERTTSAEMINTHKKEAYIGRLSTHKPNKNNRTGVRGVCWDKTRQKYMAHIYVNGRRKTLGRFENIDNAIAARQEAEEKYFKPIILQA